MSQADIRRRIADIILPSIESGIPPWRSTGRGFPTNAQTGKKYSGINPLLLDAIANQRKYRSKYWCTYKQWNILHLRVSKRPPGIDEGNWAANVINWQPFKKFVEKGDLLSLERFHLLQSYPIFNAEQVFGPDIGKYLITKQEDGDFARAEVIIEATGADIKHHPRCKAPRYDRLPKDRILLPPRSYFVDESQYMATKLHELAHYSEFRIGWGGRSLDQGELFAEIVTGYMETELGIPHDQDMTNHNKWVSVWVEKIKENPKYLLDAAAYAARSMDWIMGFTRDSEDLVLQQEE